MFCFTCPDIYFEKARKKEEKKKKMMVCVLLFLQTHTKFVEKFFMELFVSSPELNNISSEAMKPILTKFHI